MKALFRRGVAGIELLEWEQAKKDLARAIETDPQNKDARKEFQRLKQLMAEQDKKDKAMFSKMFQPHTAARAASNSQAIPVQ